MKNGKSLKGFEGRCDQSPRGNTRQHSGIIAKENYFCAKDQWYRQMYFKQELSGLDGRSAEKSERKELDTQGKDGIIATCVSLQSWKLRKIVGLPEYFLRYLDFDYQQLKQKQILGGQDFEEMLEFKFVDGRYSSSRQIC